MINHKKLITQAMEGLSAPEGPFMLAYPHKPLGKHPGKGNPKPGPRLNSSKPGRGMKQRKGGSGAGTIFAGWD